MVSTKKIKGTTKRNYIGTSRYIVAEDFYDVGTFQPYGGLRDGAECRLASLHGGASDHVRDLRHLHEAHDARPIVKMCLLSFGRGYSINLAEQKHPFSGQSLGAGICPRHATTIRP